MKTSSTSSKKYPECHKLLLKIASKYDEKTQTYFLNLWNWMVDLVGCKREYTTWNPLREKATHQQVLTITGFEVNNKEILVIFKLGKAGRMEWRQPIFESDFRNHYDLKIKNK